MDKSLRIYIYDIKIYTTSTKEYISHPKHREIRSKMIGTNEVWLSQTFVGIADIYMTCVAAPSLRSSIAVLYGGAIGPCVGSRAA